MMADEEREKLKAARYNSRVASRASAIVGRALDEVGKLDRSAQRGKAYRALVAAMSALEELADVPDR